jgi:hypothetical protein
MRTAQGHVADTNAPSVCRTVCVQPARGPYFRRTRFAAIEACAILSPRQCERPGARRSQPLHSPDNTRQRERPRGHRSLELPSPTTPRQRGRLRVQLRGSVASRLPHPFDMTSQESRRRSLSEPSLPNGLSLTRGPHSNRQAIRREGRRLPAGEQSSPIKPGRRGRAYQQG